MRKKCYTNAECVQKIYLRTLSMRLKYKMAKWQPQNTSCPIYTCPRFATPLGLKKFKVLWHFWDLCTRLTTASLARHSHFYWCHILSRFPKWSATLCSCIDTVTPPLFLAYCTIFAWFWSHIFAHFFIDLFLCDLVVWSPGHNARFKSKRCLVV
jgi:hypothetical protein